MTTLVQVLTSKASVEKNLKMPTSISDQKPSSSLKSHDSGDSATYHHQSEISSQMAQHGNDSHTTSNSTKNISQLSESIQRLDDLLIEETGELIQAAAPQTILNRDSIGKDEWDNYEGGFPLEDDAVSYNIPHSAAPESLHMVLNGGSSFNSIEGSARSEIAESVTTVSLSSRGSTPSNSLPRPLLYSAIGSLENPNAASLGSYAKKLSRVDTTGLLPPASAIAPSAVASIANKSKRSSSSNGLKNGSSRQTSSGSNGGKRSNRGDGTLSNDSQWEKQNQAAQATGTNAVDSEGNAVNSLRNIVQAKSSLRSPQSQKKKKKEKKKRVSYDLKSKKQVEMFRPSCDAYTPRIEKKKIKYKAAENRTPVQTMATTMGTLQRPNFRDALRRVAMIIHQHIVKIERRFESNDARLGSRALFTSAMKDAFSEETFCTPKYKCTMVRIPMARPGMVFGLRKIKTKYMIPSEKEIYEFAHQLFKSVQLSSECSIVCLIYVERLMEAAKVPLMACTWRPIFMCGLLLASKVWQDLSSWNIEFSCVYPQYSLDAINKLEVNFLRNIKWDLYISSSLYAKYYFALRSLVEKVDFRQRYNRMVGRVDSVAQAEALKIQERSEAVKEEALSHLSRSM
ncbi:unnamed protein product [Cylindrotheca closterium]|uniref:Cyclin N-terminal domain-containing protein n=1 Tax=Cylindrotheca closterium TaxID=2856 RepID=A0AAD2FLV4_9STRA|nr:unnamed protein product [Cylindrotheca closterium]